MNRQHAAAIDPAFAYLAETPAVHCPADKRLSAREVAEDLDQLEWLLENRYSYLALRGVDYRAALDAIRLSSSGGSTRARLSLQITKLLAILGDGHSGVSDPDLLRVGRGFSPFLLDWSNDRLVAFKADRSGFIDEEHPFLSQMDGLDMELWLRVADKVSPAGSPQLRRWNSTRTLRGTEYLRTQLGLPAGNAVAVTLTSSAGDHAKKVELPLSRDFPLYGSWPKRDSQVLGGNIGYLRIPVMDDGPEFLQQLVGAMQKFKDTNGLIIDVRGNGGGSRAPLRTLLPFFMDPNAPPHVLNVAAYRLGHKKDILSERWLYPASWEGWSAEERSAIRQFAEEFCPQWQPPSGQFSEWHYFVVDPLSDPKCYHYCRPVIVLMNADNFSAADIFLCAFKGLPNVTLMGLPSSGGSGRYMKYRLAHSDIGVRLSSMASFQPSGKLYDGNGIQPDVVVEPIPTDFIGRTDSVLDAAVATIKQAAPSARCGLE